MNHSRVLWTFLGVLLLAVPPASPLSAQGPHRAALVVDFGDGRVLVRVVAFSEEAISGVELLQRSGLDVALMGGLGGMALCAVEGVGCPPTPQDCFCQCRGGECRYWAYFVLQGGTWVYSSTGASGRLLRDGDVDGWVWGDGRTPPPLRTWEEIYALAPTEGPAPASPAIPTDAPLLPSPRPTALPAFSPTVVQPTRLPLVSPSSAGAATLPAALSLSPVPTTPATPLPQVPAAATPVPTMPLPLATPRVPSVSVSPTPCAVDVAEYGAGGWGTYPALAFGALVAVLVGLWLWARRRR